MLLVFQSTERDLHFHQPHFLAEHSTVDGVRVRGGLGAHRLPPVALSPPQAPHAPRAVTALAVGLCGPGPQSWASWPGERPREQRGCFCFLRSHLVLCIEEFGPN